MLTLTLVCTVTFLLVCSGTFFPYSSNPASPKPKRVFLQVRAVLRELFEILERKALCVLSFTSQQENQLTFLLLTYWVVLNYSVYDSEEKTDHQEAFLSATSRYFPRDQIGNICLLFYYCSNCKSAPTLKNKSKYISWGNELLEVQIVRISAGQ